MSIFAIADLHLALGVPDKSMEVFGPVWKNYTERMAENWKLAVTPDDLVLIPGDISWAKDLGDALSDLDWIDALPGTKVILRGNHDFWWSSLNKIKAILPPSLHLIQNNAFLWNGIAIGGSRLWDTPEYSFDAYIDYQPIEGEQKQAPSKEEQERIFIRELGRLETSLKQLSPKAKVKIAMTHYPPIGPELKPSRASALLEKYGVQLCVFGHLHNVKKGISLNGQLNGIHYILAAADYINFAPVRILSL
jgi:predicted phosphohydrolase